MHIDLFCVVNEMKLEHLSRYLDVMHKALDTKKEELNQYVENEIERLQPQERDAFYRKQSEDYWHLFDIIPKHFYYSFFISWYSIVECELLDLCDYINMEKNFCLERKDLAGKGTGQARLFLSKVANLTLLEKDWNELKILNKLRNIVVHRNGLISDEEINKYHKYLAKHKLLNRDNLDFLSPDIDFCRHLLAFSKEFFKNLRNEAVLLVSK